jgi:energy-coupling factor transporter ATP-binding protein EcfA2
VYDGKVIIRLKDKACKNTDELLSSSLFLEILNDYLKGLTRQKSKLLKVFENDEPTPADIRILVETLKFLTKLPCDLVVKVVDGSDQFFRDRALFNEFVEQLYNYWRALHRVVICDSVGDRLDKRPYRTFNDTVENLMHMIRSAYRDVQENITGNHPRIYRQVSAGAEIATIAIHKNIEYPSRIYKKLNAISLIRQVLIYPPLIFNTPTNKRTGSFERVDRNPLNGIDINPKEWLCYPAKVGPLVIMIYFSIQFFELGFTMSNLFELADDEDLERQPDAIFLYGVPEEMLKVKAKSGTIFFDDEENNLLVATIPLRDDFGYFGYLKKMALTLHNIKMMKAGRLPYHGAMFNITLRDRKPATVLVMGDTGAGKSETLEALRMIARDDVEDLIIIADDMGSLEIGDNGSILGYGTEMGAFVRLDDLQSGYAFGQIDRTIIMNPNQVNARVVIPVTRFSEVVKGYPVDFVLYANNYEVVSGEHPAVEAFDCANEAFDVFRAGKVMSKGTTTSTGMVGTYFANIFGPPAYIDLHDELAQKYFNAFFEKGLYVGQMRTQLGIHGEEQDGPKKAAQHLLNVIRDHTEVVNQDETVG